MIEFEITNEMLEKAEERMYNMEKSAKSVFEELFPNLDFEKDFLDNHCFTDIKYLFETVDKVEDGRDDPGFVALYKLLLWTLEGQMDELIREHAIETIRNFDEEAIEEFITWLQERGASYEEAQNPEHQIESLSCFLNEKEGSRFMRQIKPILIEPTKDAYALYLSDGAAVSVEFVCPYCGAANKIVWSCPSAPLSIFGLDCCGGNASIIPEGGR